MISENNPKPGKNKSRRINASTRRLHELGQRLLLTAADVGAILLSFGLGYRTYHLLEFTRDPRPLDFYLGSDR